MSEFTSGPWEVIDNALDFDDTHLVLTGTDFNEIFSRGAEHPHECQPQGGYGDNGGKYQ